MAFDEGEDIPAAAALDGGGAAATENSIGTGAKERDQRAGIAQGIRGDGFSARAARTR